MKKVLYRCLIFLIILNCSFNIFAEFNSYKTALAKDFPNNDEYGYYKYEGEVIHFFTHQIINDAKKAFSEKLAHHFDKDCITHTEFKNFLQEMYDNNYCLVDIFDVVGIKDDKAYFKELYVPLGKKPFLLSFDDMSYDSIGMGLSDKIILDENGEFASFTKTNNPQIEYDKEAICIIENFINIHPDFSCRNARAIICPTGYNGLLGYRINKGAKNRDEEIEKLKPVVEKLKQLNYHFACHTYNHIQVAYENAKTLFNDLEKYQDEVLPVIGKTSIFCFPCGSYITKGTKLNILNQFGYKIFFCVGDAKTMQKNGSVFLKREVLNGIALRNYRKEYSKFFDTKKIYDNKRTISFPKY